MRTNNGWASYFFTNVFGDIPTLVNTKTEFPVTVIDPATTIITLQILDGFQCFAVYNEGSVVLDMDRLLDTGDAYGK